MMRLVYTRPLASKKSYILNKSRRVMKAKLIIYLFVYAAVIAFIAMSMENSEAMLGKRTSVVCKYDAVKDGKATVRENYLEVASRKVKESGDSVYISILIYNRGSEKLLLEPGSFILMSKSTKLNQLLTDSVTVQPEKQKEIIVAYSNVEENPDCIEVIKHAGNKDHKLFAITM